MRKKVFLSITVLALLLFEPLYAQNEGAIWYFGHNAGLDFNQYYPKPLTDGKINTREGVATICDKDGNLLFYTDGKIVYNRNHDVMLDGDGLYGNTGSTQSSIIVPRPGSPTEFYIFTVDQSVADPSNPKDYKGLNYSIVDLEQNLPSGRVTQKNIRLPGTEGKFFTEKITVVKNKDKSSYWIITHEFGTENFYEFKLTGNTLNNPIIEPAGSVHPFDTNPSILISNGAGYLKSSPKGDLLVTAIEGLKFFELFKFDNSTGKIDFIAKLPTEGDSFHPLYTENAYGVEFSPTSNFLYGSSRKNGILYQWDLSSLNTTTIINSVQRLRSKSNVLCGALQLGLNGKIYVCLSNQPFLGVINSPIQKNCNYVEQGASLLDNMADTVKGGTAGYGLPTFLSDFFKAAEFYYENTCFNDLTLFYLSANRGSIKGLPSWKIFDANMKEIGNADVDAQTLLGTYRFPQPGKYFVQFYVYQAGDVYQTQEITIHPLPELNLPDITPLCKGSFVMLDAGEGAFYNWSNNPNLHVERYQTISAPGKIKVTVTHYNGCSNTDSTQVVEKPIPVIKNTVMTLATCGVANGSITLEMEEGDKYIFDWAKFRDSTSNSLHNLFGGIYDVKISSVNTTCSITRKLSVSEQGSPEITIKASIPDTICPGQSITLTASGAQNFRWENIAGNDSSSIVTVVPRETTTYLVEGYSFDSNQNKCSGFGEIMINVFPFNVPQLGADRIGCKGGDPVILDGGTDYLSWSWRSSEPYLNDTSRILKITQSYPQLNLFVTDKNQCVFTDDIKVTINPLPVINLGNDSIVMCKGKPIELYGGTGDSLLWSTGDKTERIMVDTTNIYKLSIWKSGCSNTDSIQVTIKPLPEVILNLPRDTTICLKDSIMLTGGRGDTYLWSTGDNSKYKYVKQSGIYWLKISLDVCENSDTVNLTVNPLPKVDLGRDTIYCKSNSIILSGGTGDIYSWNTGATTPQISIDATGLYQLAITKNGCVNSDTVMIRVNDPAKLGIDSVATAPVTCPGNQDGSLRIYSHGSGTSYEYSIDDGMSFFSSSWFQGLYGNNHFQIVVREDKACTAKYPKEITFIEPDSIQINYHLISPSCETCPDGEINLSIKGGTPPYSVKWSTNDTITYLTNMVLGKYLVWVTDATKCRENALIDLTLDYPPFRIPNAFTPNGDGINEKWEIAALKDFPECELKIFDRSGHLIWWSDTGYTVPWDGIDKSGNVLPVGSYYYLVWLQSDLKPLKGTVSILR